MNVICIEDAALYQLIEEVVSRIKEKYKITEDRWVNGEEAMAILKITSKTTLQKFRDTGVIRFSQPQKKLILYDRESILEFLNKNSKETF